MNVGRGCGNMNAVQMEGDALHLSISSIEVNGSNIFSVVGGCIGLGICQKVTMDISLGSKEEPAPPRLTRSSCQATPALILPKGSGIYFGNPTLSREADGHPQVGPDRGQDCMEQKLRSGIALVADLIKLLAVMLEEAISAKNRVHVSSVAARLEEGGHVVRSDAALAHVLDFFHANGVLAANADKLGG